MNIDDLYPQMKVITTPGCADQFKPYGIISIIDYVANIAFVSHPLKNDAEWINISQLLPYIEKQQFKPPHKPRGILPKCPQCGAKKVHIIHTTHNTFKFINRNTITISSLDKKINLNNAICKKCGYEHDREHFFPQQS